MAIDLTKGGKINLMKESPGLTLGRCGLGWDIDASAKGAGFDLDAFFVILGEDSKAVDGDASLIFYNNKKNANGSVYVEGDNRTGAGAGYDENGYIKFADIPANVKSVIACVSIFDFAARKQNFGQVTGAKCDVLDGDKLLTTYDLTEDMSMDTGIIAGRFMREADGSWSFKAVGEAVKGGMVEILAKYGINL
jgi:tellurium resistance protein TerD